MATTDNSSGNDKHEEPVSESMRRVVDAMVAGEPIPDDAQATLTLAEQGEVAALARTANLTYLTLQLPNPSPEAEERSLARAQQELHRRPPVTRPLPPLSPAPPSRSALQVWWDRLWGRDSRE
jgi:hypothetical protein